jgi:hypothetical protein
MEVVTKPNVGCSVLNVRAPPMTRPEIAIQICE